MSKILLRKWRWLLLLATVTAITLGWKVSTSRATTTTVPELSKASAAAAVKVLREDLAEDLATDAELRPYQEIDLHAKVSGYVEAINVDIGDVVKAGQVLATIEVPELQDDIRRADASVKRSKEEVERARAAYEDAHLVFTRLQGVVKARPNLVAPQELDNATGKDRSAASAVAAAEAQVDIAKAELSKLKTMECYCKITAPFAGVITERFADPGALIPAGTSSGGQGSSLFRLSQNDKLRLDIPVSVSYAARVKPGDPVDVHIPSLDQTFSGVVARSTRKVDTATRTLKVEVDVPNPSLKILPGMYAAASLRLDTRKHTLVLPVEAVSRGRNISVLLVNKHNKLEERAIGLGLETPAKVEVLTGLSENDVVLVGSRSQFRPGQLVEPRMMASADARK